MTDTKYTTMTLQIQMREPVGSALLVANLEDHIVVLIAKGFHQGEVGIEDDDSNSASGWSTYVLDSDQPLTAAGVHS